MINRLNANEVREAQRQRLRRHPLRLVRAYFYDLWTLVNEARITLLGFLILTIINTFYLTLFHPDPKTVVVAFFVTLRLFAFDISEDLPADIFGRILFFVTPFLGVTLLFQGILDFGRFLFDKGSRREAWQVALASTYQNHIIVCGVGRIGYRVTLQLLDAGYDVVAVDRNWKNSFVQEILKFKVPVILGDARELDVLHRAGLSRAHSIIAPMSNDLLNIEVALAARRFCPDVRVIMRIFSDELDQNLEATFGQNTAFSSSALAAPTLSAAAVSCDISHVIPVADALLGMSEIRVAHESLLTGFASTIEERYGVRVVQWFDEASGRWRWFDSGRRFTGGDVVLIMGTIDALEKARVGNQPNTRPEPILKPERVQQSARSPCNRVIVCGISNVGYRVVKGLHRQSLQQVVFLCDEEAKSHFIDEFVALGVRVERGDARNMVTLRRAGLEEAYSIVAVTSDHLVNIQICLAARHLRPDIDVVLRVFSDALAAHLEGVFGSYSAYSSSALAAPTLAAAAVEADISYAINVGDQLLSIMKLGLAEGDAFVDKSIAQVYNDMRVVVMHIYRGGAGELVPGPNTLLQHGDTVTVMIDLEQLSHLRSQPPDEKPRLRG